MGFGSYDESEQENQSVNTEDLEDQENSVNRTENDGEVVFEFDDTDTDELLEKLNEM